MGLGGLGSMSHILQCFPLEGNLSKLNLSKINLFI